MFVLRLHILPRPTGSVIANFSHSPDEQSYGESVMLGNRCRK
jgi:hypothetical protein